jgi:hypothetical protein
VASIDNVPGLDDLDAPTPETAETPSAEAPTKRSRSKKPPVTTPPAPEAASPASPGQVATTSELSCQVAYRPGMPCDQTPGCMGKWSVLSSRKNLKERILERHLICEKCKKKAPNTQKVPL